MSYPSLVKLHIRILTAGILVSGLVFLTHLKPLTIQLLSYTSSSANSSSCRHMFTVENLDRERLTCNYEQPYGDLSRQLPTLLVHKEVEEHINRAQIYMDTRLKSLRGAIPYLPCAVSYLFIAICLYPYNLELNLILHGKGK